MPEEKFHQGEATTLIKTTSQKFLPDSRVRRSDFEDESRFDALVESGAIAVKTEQASPAKPKASKTPEA